MGLHGRLSGGGTLRGRLRSASGGNTFTMQPVYNTGLKIADYEEDGEPGELYIPNPIIPDNLADMTWTKIIDIPGGSYSAYTDVSSYKYVAVCFIYQGIDYNPYFYKLSDLDKLLSMTGEGEIAKGYQWSVDGNYDNFGIHYRSDKTISIKATYSGIQAVAYGIV